MQWPHGGFPHSRKAWLTMMIFSDAAREQGRQRLNAGVSTGLHRFLITHPLHPTPYNPHLTSLLKTYPCERFSGGLLFPVPCSLFPVPYSLFPIPCSLKPRKLYLIKLIVLYTGFSIISFLNQMYALLTREPASIPICQ